MMNERYYQHLIAINGVVELRGLSGQAGTVGGLFDDPAALLGQLRDRRWNWYTTVNKPRGGLAATNAVTRLRAGDGLGNDDMERRTHLLIDLDPVRPKGVASTDAEMAAARQQAGRIRALLSSLGWPEPAEAHSGNGSHLLYRCALPADPDTGAMLAALYQGMSHQWGTPAVRFDSSVHNAGRVVRAYGSLNWKGVSTAERPHRMAECWLPCEWRTVSRRQVLALAEALRPAQRPVVERKRPATAAHITHRGDWSTLDLVGWLRSTGHYHRDLGRGVHSIVCPWEAGHSTASPPTRSDCVAFEPGINRSGLPGFFCHHDSCSGRRFVDLARQLGGVDAWCSRTMGAAS